jgi:SAM-dependent methyltransferase
VDKSAISIHSAFDEVEDEFHRVLEVSLSPRGPESLYDLVASLNLPPGSKAVDVGCGRGEQAIELAERFGFDVLGIDPVARYGGGHATKRIAPGSVAFQPGTAEAMPVDSGTVDLVFCRESLMFSDLHLAAGEFSRILRRGGRGLVYLVLSGPLMHDVEATAFHTRSRLHDLRPDEIDQALSQAGLAIDQRVDFQGEWGERQQEETGKPGHRLLYASRLLREPDRYIRQFGKDNYDIMLGDCLWHVYWLIGKLTGYACTFTKG